jgi:hypothetical protein
VCETMNAYKIAFWDPKGKIPLWRPRLIEKVILKLDLNKPGRIGRLTSAVR